MLYDLVLCLGLLLSQGTVPACLSFPEAFQGQLQCPLLFMCMVCECGFPRIRNTLSSGVCVQELLPATDRSVHLQVELAPHTHGGATCLSAKPSSQSAWKTPQSFPCSAPFGDFVSLCSFDQLYLQCEAWQVLIMQHQLFPPSLGFDH